MENLNIYREKFIHEINSIAAENNIYPEVAIIQNVSDYVIDYIDGLKDNSDYIENPSSEMRKKVNIDAFCIESRLNMIQLAKVLPIGREMNFIKNLDVIKNAVDELVNFVENTLNGCYKDRSENFTDKQFSTQILNNITEISKIQCIVITTDVLEKEQISNEFKSKILSLKGYKFKIDVRVIDIKDIATAKYFNEAPEEELIIDVRRFGYEGIPCIKADLTDAVYDAYLAILPGDFLANIYKEHADQLLSSNVRSFLKSTTKVNRGIRTTILQEQDKFFAYNNGVSTIVSDVELEEIPDKGMCFTKFKGLKIINGGQTTASLASAFIKDKADLKNIFVMMKITKISKQDDELALNIAAYANSQNKVTATDLNSGHQYFKKIKLFSERIFTPNNPPTRWYFEQLKGSYEQQKMRMDKDQMKTFEVENPRRQMFKISDIAKWVNSHELKPHLVSKGSEVNAMMFYTNIKASYEKSSDKFNELYFKELISMGIFFKYIQEMISKQTWYIEKKAYRAQAITYTFSKFIHEFQGQISKHVNYLVIWNNQEVPEEIKEELKKIAKLVYDIILQGMGNIGEYCKKEECWKRIKDTKYTMSDDVRVLRMSDADRKKTNFSFIKEEKKNTEVSREIEIFSLGTKYWKDLLEKAMKLEIINLKQEDLIRLAINFSLGQKAISSKQATEIFSIKDKLKEHGL